jgi:hypothetical protein
MYALAKAEHEQKTWVWVACYKSTHPGIGERDALISALDLLIEDEHVKAPPGSLKVSNPTGIPTKREPNTPKGRIRNTEERHQRNGGHLPRRTGRQESPRGPLLLGQNPCG